MTTTTRRRGTTAPTIIADSIERLLTTTAMSVAEVAAELDTNKRYVREIADARSLPTNRPVTLGGRVETAITSYCDRYGVVKTREKFRLSPSKLRTVLNP